MEELEDCEAIVAFPDSENIFTAFVTSPAFEGKSSHQRTVLVYDAVKEYMNDNGITGYDNNRLLTPQEEEDLLPS